MHRADGRRFDAKNAVRTISVVSHTEDRLAALLDLQMALLNSMTPNERTAAEVENARQERIAKSKRTMELALRQRRDAHASIDTYHSVIEDNDGPPSPTIFIDDLNQALHGTTLTTKRLLCLIAQGMKRSSSF